MDGYVPLKAFVKYNLPFDGLYVKADAGARIGVGEGRKVQPVVGAGLGYEMGITDTISVFGEANLDLVFAEKVQAVPGITVGAKITF